jgi:hypothetical protein
MPIADHIWPSLYPGIIIGAIYGLSLRGFWNLILGAAGGLVGAGIALPITSKLGLTEGLPSLIVLVVLALLGAYVFTRSKALVLRQ